MPPENSAPFAWRFTVGPFPVVILPSFWFMSAMMGWDAEQPQYTFAWVVLCFVSILVHELGHAFAARLFGCEASIQLYSFGGLCFPDRALPRWKDVVMSLAGPGAGFLLGGIIWGFYQWRPPTNEFTAFMSVQGKWLNFAWGFVNLMPVLPLDGGHVLSSLLGPSRRRVVLAVSIVAAIGVAVAFAAIWRSPYAAVMFAFLALRNVQSWNLERPVIRQKPAPVAPDVLPRAWEALRAGHADRALQLGHQALSAAKDGESVIAVRDLLAWAELAAGDARAALLQLEKVPRAKARPLTWALALEAAGFPDRALPFAREALAADASDRNAALTVRLLLALGEVAQAEAVRAAHPWSSPATAAANRAAILLQRGDALDAAQAYAEAFSTGGRPDHAFHAATGFARAGQLQPAAEWLAKALDSGFDDADQISSEAALQPVRADPKIAERLGRA